MSDPYETTEAHLERLLGRALNSFELPDATVERLGAALAHSSSLYSSHHSSASGLHRETYRHTCLLHDGSTLTLWELAYRTGGDTMRYELYADQSEACLAASRLGGEPGGGAVEFALSADTGEADELAVLGALLATPPTAPRRVYVPDDSADHARRLLRRAENGNRPGQDMARLLRGAYAHRITQAFGRQCAADGPRAGAAFMLYEHGFVLADGSEISLWEVEHTATPDGRHMCEVYATEAGAREAMELRARVR
ncbi:DUF6227 family protein [Streptomyces sp. A3M-1-3]|uniref:DUF6227 family protein n=1 Tax=Streptomyces sp. A3M-1-3 TaxID=2962044 RepID=UPI0020B816A4|nr:DUF6227 family protein [Streptomyces sp. A3M-1-3]MCP3820360.1 DUF6227 family protein [Streptomyces sp. A3M-1-3]